MKEINKIYTYKCIKIESNPYMGNEIYSEPNTIIYFDKNNIIKVGDIIKIEKDENKLYRRIWVNDILITNDDTNDEEERANQILKILESK